MIKPPDSKLFPILEKQNYAVSPFPKKVGKTELLPLAIDKTVIVFHITIGFLPFTSANISIWRKFKIGETLGLGRRNSRTLKYVRRFILKMII